MISLLALGPARLAGALLVAVLFAALCIGTAWRGARRRRVQQHDGGGPSGTDAADGWLVVHASQTGTAEQLAWQTARALQLAGATARVRPISGLTKEMMQRVRHALFIVSTYGEGDPPDAAATFVRDTMLAKNGPRALEGLKFGVLALGDRSYARFCGFGRLLHEWLQQQGGEPLFGRIDADRVADAAIGQWQGNLARLAGAHDASAWAAAPFTQWTLTARRHLNPGSAGEAVHHLELAPANGSPLPHWEAGDLLQVRVPGEAQPREYSIASIPVDGSVHLLVRQARRPDGTPGAASGWLLGRAAIGDGVDARIREHRGFRLGENAGRPLILIGNGTGLAGLRALLKAREAQPPGPSQDARCWLIFGERSARCDAFHAADIERWRRSGLLTDCDLVHSRDQPQRRYVQHRLIERRQQLAAWIAAGAAIYVCGSLKGMATAVDAALRDILGSHDLDELAASGRYRRDVY